MSKKRRPGRPKTPPPVLTVTTAADMLEISRSQLYRLVKQGLPAHKVGARMRFSRDELISWVEDQPPPKKE